MRAVRLLGLTARLLAAVLTAVVTFVALFLMADWIGTGDTVRQIIVWVMGIVGLATGVVAFMFVLLGPEVFAREVPGETSPQRDATSAPNPIRFRAHP